MKKAILVKTLALAACAFAVHNAEAHSPAAVDASGNRCIQMDCGKDQIVNRCQFPVQLTYECGQYADCGIDAAGTYNNPAENGVTVIGNQFFSQRWHRNVLRPDGFYPMQVNRKTGMDKITLNPADSKHPIRGFACAIHTGGDVTSAGTEWRNPVPICVHTHADGSKHEDAHSISSPDFECPAEFVRNWAGNCMQMKYEPPTPDSPLNPVYLVNNCECPVALDACHEDEHPCNEDDSTQDTLAPGESTQVGSTNLQGFRTEWAACFQNGTDTYAAPEQIGENSWACSQVKTACSTTFQVDSTETATKFQTMRHVWAVAETGVEAPQTAETQPQEDNDPLAALRGAPPPTDTPTAKALKICDAGQLNPDAVVNTKGNKTEVGDGWRCGWFHSDGHLHVAARLDDLESARWLLANGADVNAKNVAKLTPLHRAAYVNARETAELLLQNGAEINALSRVPNTAALDGTPLYVAVYQDAHETVELLLQNGADANVRNDHERTPLHSATVDADYEMMELLLQNGADVNAIFYERTPLDSATENYLPEEIQSLLRQHGGRCIRYKNCSEI